jgi:hypothetical protein
VGFLISEILKVINIFPRSFSEEMNKPLQEEIIEGGINQLYRPFKK